MYEILNWVTLIVTINCNKAKVKSRYMVVGTVSSDGLAVTLCSVYATPSLGVAQLLPPSQMAGNDSIRTYHPPRVSLLLLHYGS